MRRPRVRLPITTASPAISPSEERRGSPGPPRERADAALRAFLGRVFDERSEFGFDSERFELAYDGARARAVRGPLHQHGHRAAARGGPRPGHDRAPARRRSVARPRRDARRCAARGGLGHVRARRAQQRRAERPDRPDQRAGAVRPLAGLRRARALSPDRSPRCGCSSGAATRSARSHGRGRIPACWRAVALGSSGRPRLLTFIGADQEDELRAFCNLIARRAPSGGELAWALARFEMGCERLAPFEALTDYLLALRALLEPEGPGSGRLAQRLAVLCAQPEDRAALAERTARAIALERSVIAGLAPAHDRRRLARRRDRRAPARAAARRAVRAPRRRSASAGRRAAGGGRVA